MKTAKKIFKIIGIIAGVVVAVLIVYIIYLYASYHRIEDNLSLEVESHAQADVHLTTEKEYSALTYNIGFWCVHTGFQLLYGWRQIFLGEE
mgnify:CR=1 FL=1